MTATPDILVRDDHRFRLPRRFTEFRPDQLKFAEIAASMLSTGTDVVCVEATVGFGKSLFCEMVRQLMGVPMVMAVPRIDLQKQFMESFPYARLIQGRSNFPHGGAGGRAAYPAITCADCNDQHYCKAAFNCHYKRAKLDFMQAQVGVTNLSYFIVAANYLKMFNPGQAPKGGEDSIESWDEKEGGWGPDEDEKDGWYGNYLTCFDEADCIEDALLGFLGTTLNINYVKYVLQQVKAPVKCPMPPVTKFEEWPKWLDHIKMLLGKALKEFGKPDKDNVEEVRFHSKLSKTILSLSMVQPDWIYDPARVEGKSGRKTGEAWKVKFSPLMVGELGKTKLWDKCGPTLCVSGSFVNHGVFMEETGLDKTDKKVEFMRTESKWDKRRKLIHRVPGIKVVKENRSGRWKDQEFWDLYIGNIAWILFKYPNERSLIHAVSHEMAQDIGDALLEIFGPDKVFVDRGEKIKIEEDDTPEDVEQKLADSDMLAKYLATPGSVLVSARLGRGTDLKDSACRNIILAKVPFPYLGDRRIEARLNRTKTGEVYYMIHTVRELIQYFGRGNRHENDWVRIWVMDESFDRIVKMRGLLPNYFTDTIRNPGDYMSLFPALKELEP